MATKIISSIKKEKKQAQAAAKAVRTAPARRHMAAGPKVRAEGKAASKKASPNATSAQVYTMAGAKAATIELPAALFGALWKPDLVHQVTTAIAANKRQNRAHTKDRSEVSGGGKKPWKQKGTGRARAGSIRSPIWRGGGKTFAAVPRDHSQKVNRKMYRGALRSIVAELARQNHLIVVDSFPVEAAKTKALAARLAELGTQDILIVTGELDQNLFLSARNIPHMAVCDVESLNPVALLRHQKVLITSDAVKKLEAWLQ